MSLKEPKKRKTSKKEVIEIEEKSDEEFKEKVDDVIENKILHRLK